ncbi:CO dehydrogenase/acetyl-CoA synthase, delta subunit [Methanococcus aeolicus Nankai-3]|jgi:acetyl-CoA decarbonylase/synthase complex subunit delta|uniref:Acetyl-CoA decarbonylase/synthase complex subunit delta n=1 Tax=Methanococcus aeolicus (strain ATCC BAA-1280 / DSM 17508 / OCM 812 / Nankai-3) TaxID=419665 RepID=A6UTI0_META3|nr:CO dehydrogenase/acetyl-CoA synthase subunit delta [Methanococcus aeolicus]ABR55802.1 CO dehydrogenase/acetyl-CoA synthase, delta subunit [Methanococcus aeolicus Nankai-3]
MDFDSLMELVKKTGRIEINDISITADELIINIPSAPPMRIPQTPAMKQTLAESGVYEDLKISIPDVDWELPINTYKGNIREVQFGRPKSEGGRGKVIKIGGQKALYRFEEPQPNNPVVTFDIFDVPMPGLPKNIRTYFEEVMHDPAEWAKLCVDKFGADMITMHHISTDPKLKDTSPRDAAKLMEDVLQAVDVPFVIGGSGDPSKDPKVLEACAEVAEGEKCLLASANLDLDYKKVADVAMKYDHNVLSWTIMDPNMAKDLNKKLIAHGLEGDRIVMDPTTCSLGYGSEFSINAMTRLRINGLKGDEFVNMPMSSGTTNAIGAREAWMVNPEWGDRQYRLPLWEITTGLSMLLSGVDIFMMLHPLSIAVLKEFGQTLTTKPNEVKLTTDNYEWIKA